MLSVSRQQDYEYSRAGTELIVDEERHTGRSIIAAVLLHAGSTETRHLDDMPTLTPTSDGWL